MTSTGIQWGFYRPQGQGFVTFEAHICSRCPLPQSLIRDDPFSFDKITHISYSHHPSQMVDIRSGGVLCSDFIQHPGILEFQKLA